MKISSNKPLDRSVMMKYVEYHNNIDLESYESISEEEIIKKLQNDQEDHQKWTFVLAHRDKPLAYHALDEFQKRLEPGFLHDRCEMAKQEAAMWIENELLEEGQDTMIMGGVGGQGQMLRYYISLFPAEDTIKSIQETLNGRKQKDVFIIESSESIASGLVLTILIHIDYSIDEVIMKLIDDLIKEGHETLRGYGALNTEYPSEEFIEDTRTYLESQEKKGLL